MHFSFIRVEPIQELQTTSYKLQTTHNRQPQHTLCIDLAQSEESILGAMHPKTRYNVHLAEKKGVVVSEKKDSELFWQLNQETIARDKFKSHSKEYYKAMLELPMVHQLNAYDGTTSIASNIVIVSGDTCTYLHGVSGSSARNLMAPYLLQWRGIQLGKTLGCRWYDLWGAAPPRMKGLTTCFHTYCWQADHPWTGITRFKAGFAAQGGSFVSYPEAVDVVFRPVQYKAYTLAHRMRRML